MLVRRFCGILLLKADIEGVQNSPTALHKLVGDAEKTIAEKFVPDSRSTYEYKMHPVMLAVKLDTVMRCMFSHAKNVGVRRENVTLRSLSWPVHGKQMTFKHWKHLELRG
jgi:hypothetical protein